MPRLFFLLPLILVALIACDAEKRPEAGGASGDSGTERGIAGEEKDTLSRFPIPYDVTPAQRDAITALLREQPEWRVAADGDNRNAMLADMQREKPGYRPYFTAYDFNRDGIGDFAITLLRDTTFRFYWFRGKGSGYDTPVLLVEESWLANGGQIIKDSTLVVGEFRSDHLISFPPNRVTGGLRAVVAPRL